MSLRSTQDLGGEEGVSALEGAPVPPVVTRETWQRQLDELVAREKDHTREGDLIAAVRRRLPMVEVDARTLLTGAAGQVALLDVFEGRRQLLAYFHMWHNGKPAPEQCEGCTFFNGQVRELSYLHSRDVTYVAICQGSYEESVRYRDFMGWTMPWYSAHPGEEALVAGRWFGMIVGYLRIGDRVFETYWTSGRGTEVMAPAYALLDMTVYGRQETFEDSPEGWPQRFPNDGSQFRTGPRPSAQWERLSAGRSDDLSGSPRAADKAMASEGSQG